MPVPLLEVGLYQGDTFRLPLNAKSSDGATPPNYTSIDLTGCTAQMMIRANYIPGQVAPLPLISLTTENGGITLGGTAGTIVLYLTAAQTLALRVAVSAGYNPSSGVAPTSIYVADLHIIFPSGDRIPYATFVLTVYGTVTR